MDTDVHVFVGLLLRYQHDAKPKIMDLEIGVAAKAIGDATVLRAAEPTAAADDAKLAFGTEWIHDAVAIRVRQHFVFPFTRIKAPFPDIARHIINA